MKKNLNKSFTLILSCAMIIAMYAPVYGEVITNDYETHWAREAIKGAIDSGMAMGYPDGSFKPNNAITRSEFFSFVNNSFNFTEPSVDNFTDVADDSWYEQVIAIAKEAGYIKGYPDGSIQPEMLISRQEVAVIISRIKALTPTDRTMDYADASSIANWSKQAISDLYDVQVMIGYPDGTFKPEDNITRAEAIVALTKILNYQVVAKESDGVNGTEPTTEQTIPTTEGTLPITEGTLPITEVTLPIVQDTESLIVSNPVELGMAGEYVILTKTGISSVPNSVITGNIGVSPIDSTSITGFSLTVDASNQYSVSTQIIGKAFAADYTIPTSSNLTTAISNMETAYTDAAARAADYTELYSGDLSGKTLTAGVYKWGTGVLINSDLTLSGGPDDVFIFQIAGGITQANATNIILKDGVQAKNIFWQTAESVSIGTGSHFEGNVLSMTNIIMKTNSSINGRLLAQTAVTLDQATVAKP